MLNSELYSLFEIIIVFPHLRLRENALDPCPEVIKLFSCSAELRFKFKVLISTEIAKINLNFRFRSAKPVIYPADKC